MPSWAWCLIFWVVFNILTTLGVSVYGELEYIFGMFKFISLAVLFFLAILANVGAFGGGYTGFKYWGAPTGPIIHGINGFGQVFVLAAAYYVGTEIVSLAAAESKNPQRDVPRGTNSIVYRILFVFVGMTFFQGLICPSDSPQLLSASSKVASSPFTIGFELAGWHWAGHFVNAIILVAFVSAGNGVVYVQSRTLHSMALTGRAPKFFATVTKRGVPWPAILVSNLWGFLSLMNRKLAAGQVFSYITSVGGTAAYIAWIAIIFVHLRVRAAAEKQGIDVATFPFRAWGSIWIYRANFAFNIFLLFIQGFVVFEKPFDWRGFVACYITLPTFVVLYVGFKWWNKTKWVKLEDIDFSDRKEWVVLTGDEEAREGLRKKVARLIKD
jgi:amino acid transporter